MSHLHIVKKHLIGNADQLGIYTRGIDKINETLELIGQKGYDASVAVKLSVPKNVQENPELFAGIRSAMSQMPAKVLQIYDPVCAGPGVSTRIAYFNETFSHPRGIVSDVDYDQVVLHTQEGLEALMELAKKTERDGKLFGINSRNVPVIMGPVQSVSDRRIIHEGVHSIAVGPETLRADNPPEGITPLYRELGESTSGAMMMNQAHLKYAWIVEDMIAASRIANMNGFATNYFLTIRTAELGGIATGWGVYEENYYASVANEAMALEGTDRMIRTQTGELGKTVVGDKVRRTVNDPKTEAILAEFYPRDEVRHVLDVMGEALDPTTKSA